MKILFILQNAYQSEKYNWRNEEEWSRDLARSHSGRRLKEMIPGGHEFAVINSSPQIGATPDSCFAADLSYLSQKITEIKPNVICACGRVAQDGLSALGIKFIAAPHPAWRLLSKVHTKAIRERIRKRLARASEKCTS